MDLGLSRRMLEAVREFVPKASSHLPPNGYDPVSAIDLSNGQNEVVRPELAEFFQNVIVEKFTEEDFGFPAGNGGNVELRNALASFFNKYFHPVHAVRSDNIVLTAGASDAIESVVHALCDEGDSIIVPGPYWYGFDSLCKFRSNVNIIVAQPPSYNNYDNYLIPSLQTVYDFAPRETQSRIKAVLLCNPHNPTSKCYHKQALIDCLEFCQERGLHLICDEIYALTRLKDSSRKSKADFTSVLSLTEPLVPEGAVKVDPSKVHVIWSPSKLLGTSGLRVGCLISQQNSPLLNAVSMLTSGHTNNVASKYLTSLLSWPQLPTILALNSERLSASYNLLSAFLRKREIDFIAPTDGIFVFAKLARRARTEEDETSFYDRMSACGVMVSQGRRYRGVKGEFGWCRIRFSIKEEVMRSALEKMDSFLSKER